MNKEAVKAFENGKKVALWMGGSVYAGVVLLFVAFYETLMTGQFSGFLGVIARIGAFLVAGNCLALPVALHYWTVEKKHKITASIFYSLDIILMALNVIAAAALQSTGSIPAWVLVYKTYSPASIIFVLAGWAILFMTDPGQRALVSLSDAITNAQVDIVKRVAEYASSDDGIEKIIQPVAAKLAAQVLNERSLIGGARSLPVDVESPASSDEISTGNLEEAFQELFELAGANGNSPLLAKEAMKSVNPTKASTKK